MELAVDGEALPVVEAGSLMAGERTPPLVFWAPHGKLSVTTHAESETCPTGRESASEWVAYYDCK